MAMNKFVTIGGFALGATSVFMCCFDELPMQIWIFFLIAMYFLIWLLMWIEKKIVESQGQFINQCFYYLGKNEEPYKIEYVETCYKYLEKNKMEYSKKVELKPSVNNLSRYEEKFCWSSYSSDIDILPLYEGQKIINMASRNLWNILEIDLGDRYKKRDRVKTGMRIIGLNDKLGVARPFLSNKTEKKIKERMMIVEIPKGLKPINAKFEICPSGETGKVLRSEPLQYDNKIQGFSKLIRFPRKGWSYSIVWEWGE